jgi:hypothetical protein
MKVRLHIIIFAPSGALRVSFLTPMSNLCFNYAKLLTPLAHFRRSFFALLQFVDESTLTLSAVFLQVSVPISTSITQTMLLKHHSILCFIGLTSFKAEVHRAHQMRTLVADVLCSKLSVFQLYFVTLSLDCLIASAPASAGGTDRDLAGTQFPRNCVPYNIIEF